MKRVRGDTIVSQTLLATAYTYDLYLDEIDVASIQVVYADATPAAKAFAEADVHVVNNTITEAAHGYPTGLKGQFTTTTTLPSGLSLATDYYVIRVDANTYKVATSLANAAAGTAVDLADDGTGTHTFTPTALGSVVLKLQKSNDGVNFEDLTGHTVTISAAGHKVWELGTVSYRIARLVHTPSAGALTFSAVLNAKQG